MSNGGNDAGNKNHHFASLLQQPNAPSNEPGSKLQHSLGGIYQGSSLNSMGSHQQNEHAPPVLIKVKLTWNERTELFKDVQLNFKNDDPRTKEFYLKPILDHIKNMGRAINGMEIAYLDNEEDLEVVAGVEGSPQLDNAMGNLDEITKDGKLILTLFARKGSAVS